MPLVPYHSLQSASSEHRVALSGFKTDLDEMLTTWCQTSCAQLLVKTNMGAFFFQTSARGREREGVVAALMNKSLKQGILKKRETPEKQHVRVKPDSRNLKFQALLLNHFRIMHRSHLASIAERQFLHPKTKDERLAQECVSPRNVWWPKKPPTNPVKCAKDTKDMEYLSYQHHWQHAIKGVWLSSCWVEALYMGGRNGYWMWCECPTF